MPLRSSSRRSDANHSRPTERSQWRPGEWIRWQAYVLAGLATAFSCTQLSAQTSVLHGVVFTTLLPAGQQTFTNVEVASLDGLHAVDAIGNDSMAMGALSTPQGRFTVSSHGCSGGGPGFGGQANGGAHGQVILDYLIVSPNLAAGTPVSVAVAWSVTSRVTTVGEDMVGANTGADAAAAGQVALAVNGVTLVNLSGTYSSRSMPPQQLLQGNAGSLHMDGGSGQSTFTVLVGQAVRVSMSGTASSASSVEAGTTDADVQLAMVWGVTALDPNASAVLMSDPNEPAPPSAMATLAHAVEILPPRQPHLLPCFRITTQPIAVSACLGGAANFSLVPLGAGPFTYQWRKSGVSLDIALNPSAATAVLSLSNLAPADAGPYDCVVTNPCGSIPSSVAQLTIPALPQITQQPSDATVCPSGAAPFSVTASGSGQLTYRWQVQSMANPTSWQDLSDDPGAPLPCTGGPGGFAFATPGAAGLVTIGMRPCPGNAIAPQHFRVRCVVSNSGTGCGSTTSSEATYTICPADFNCDGHVTVNDIFDFLAAWFASDPRADFNGANGIGVQDIFDYLTAWFAGC